MPLLPYPQPQSGGGGGGGGDYDDTELRNKIAAQQAKNAEQDTKLAGLRTDVDDLRADLEALELTVSDLGDDVVAAVDKAQEALAAANAAQADVDALEQEVADLEATTAAKLSDHETRITGLRTDVNALTNRVGQAEGEIDQIDADLATAEATIAQHTTLIAGLRTDLDAALTRIAALEAAVVTLQRSLGRRGTAQGTIRLNLPSAILAGGSSANTVTFRQIQDANPGMVLTGTSLTATYDFDDQVNDPGGAKPRSVTLNIGAAQLDTSVRAFLAGFNANSDQRVFFLGSFEAAGYPVIRFSPRNFPVGAGTPASAVFSVTLSGSLMDQLQSFDNTAYRQTFVANSADVVDETYGGRLDTYLNELSTAIQLALIVISQNKTSQGNAIAALQTQSASNKDRLDTLEPKVTTNTQDITNLRQTVSGLTQLTGTKLLGKTRIKTSGSNVDLAQFAPSGTTEFEVVAVGGGASGCARYSGNLSDAAGVNGGMPGYVRRTGRLPYAAGLKATLTIGAGGARATPTNTGIFQNVGGDTSAVVRKADNTLVYSLLARAGMANGILNANQSTIQVNRSYMSGNQYYHPPTAIAGSSISSVTVNGGSTAPTPVLSAQSAVDAPTGGGGCTGAANGSLASIVGGAGGDIQNTMRPEFASATAAAGGTWRITSGGVTQNNAVWVPVDPVNAFPDEAGSMGPGGYGGRFNGQTADPANTTPGGDGGFPGGGGGAGFAQITAADTRIYGGRGGDGVVDIFFYGVPPQNN